MVKLNDEKDVDDEAVSFCMEALNQPDVLRVAELNESTNQTNSKTSRKRKREVVHHRRVWCVSSFFKTMLCKESHGDILRFGKKAVPNIFKLEKMIIPINIGGTVKHKKKQKKQKTQKKNEKKVKGHWTSIHVDFGHKTISYKDSLFGNETQGKKYNRLVLDYLQKKYRIQYDKTLKINDWTLEHCRDNTPQQNNSFDCAVFVCTLATYTILGLDVNTIHPRDMHFYRRRLAMDILQGKIEKQVAPKKAKKKTAKPIPKKKVRVPKKKERNGTPSTYLVSDADAVLAARNQQKYYYRGKWEENTTKTTNRNKNWIATLMFESAGSRWGSNGEEEFHCDTEEEAIYIATVVPGAAKWRYKQPTWKNGRMCTCKRCEGLNSDM